jgi:hypothetical protein
MRFDHFAISVVIAALGFGAAQAAPKWPPLPKHGFIRGRVAQPADVAKGNALFVMKVDGKLVGKAVGIAIPQYACVKSSRTPVIVVQAEAEPNGLKLVGERTLKGETMIGMLGELDLLGAKPGRAC